MGKGKTPWHASVTDPTDRERVRRAVARLSPAQGLHDGYLWSACAYLLADGQPLNDGRIMEQARRRKAHFDACMKRNDELRRAA